MKTESPRAWKDARAGKSIAADYFGSRLNRPHTQPEREPFRIVLAPGLWGRRVDVSVEPATVTHPLCSFRDHAEAMAFAEALARTECWPITDRTSDG
jgi:hypothetical protein